MQHASLAAIGRRATIETQDSLSDSFEGHSSKETSSRSPERLSCGSGAASPLPSQPPRVLRLDEVLEHLRAVDHQLRALHVSRYPILTPPLATSCGQEISPNDTAPSTVICCRRLREFIRVAKRAIELHVASVRLETFNSSLLELSQSVNQMAEQEYANVSASATDLMNAFTRSGNSRRISNSNPAKTRMSSVRGICEGLRQGLSLVSRTNTLLSSEFGEFAPLPTKTYRHTLIVVSVLIAASHIVNSGLLLLSQSDLTRYTHAELWEITRGMEELSMLTEQVQEQLDEKKQFQLRRLLLDECPFSSVNVPLEQRLSELSLLTDPIDSLRPASVGHIIYLLARYRSSALARILAGDLLQALGCPEGRIDFLTEVVRKEYEFCSNFLDVMTQSTELLRNLRRAQETVDAHPRSILHQMCPISSVQRTNSRICRKSVHISKTESIDKFISTFSEKPSKEAKPSALIEEGDEDRGEKHQKKVVHWSDYYEVPLRHQVVGRYLQLTWLGISEELDGLLQVVHPTDLTGTSKASPPWPLLSKHQVRQLISRLQEFGTRDGLPLAIKNGIYRQAERVRLNADIHDWLAWRPDKWISEAGDKDVFYTPLGQVFKNFFTELLKSRLIEVEELLKRLSENARKCFERLGLNKEPTSQQVEFSHRLLRLHLSQCFRVLDKFLAGILQGFQRIIIGAQSHLESAPTVTEIAFKACHHLNLCLSLLDLLRFALEYFASFRGESDNPRLIAEVVSSTFEEEFIAHRLVDLEGVDGQMALCAAHSRFWTDLALQQSFVLNRELTNADGPNVAEIERICGVLLKVVENFHRFDLIGHNSLTGSDYSASEVGTNGIRCPELNAKLASTIAQTTLACLERGFSANVSANAVSRINSIQCLLAKLLAFIDHIEVSEFISSEKQNLLSRCISLVDRLQPKRMECCAGGGSGNRSSSQTRSRDAVNRLQQYFSENVLIPLHNSTPFSTLETLSANVRAYFHTENIVSRPFGSSTKDLSNKR
uniref:Uncharacterized protein n=1 Tax=Echinococcus granulosus TaxID=6210 RepID=A0A068WCJ2_ECHGR|nr:hypothetical protein EgrG_000771000 [Echinococcus granulosus]